MDIMTAVQSCMLFDLSNKINPSLQPRLHLRDDDQQVAVCVGEDLVQLDLHRLVRVDAGGTARPRQQRLRLNAQLVPTPFSPANSITPFTDLFLFIFIFVIVAEKWSEQRSRTLTGSWICTGSCIICRKSWPLICYHWTGRGCVEGGWDVSGCLGRNQTVLTTVWSFPPVAFSGFLCKIYMEENVGEGETQSIFLCFKMLYWRALEGGG